jgi:exosortase C (VPDSG-CTERM-specific)
MLTEKINGAGAEVPPLGQSSEVLADRAGALRRATIGFFVYLAVLAAVFGIPLLELTQYALNSQLFSHVLLVPFIFAYLVWIGRHTLPNLASRAPVASAITFALGLATVAAWLMVQISGVELARNDSLALSTLAFVLLALGGLFFFLGGLAAPRFGFAIAFLAFMVPFPGFVIEAIETFFQHTSALAAYGFIQLAGTPVFREGLVLHVPGLSVEVAPECSGIRSSLVLFMTSILAGHLLLRTAWKRAAFVGAVIPIGIARNALRIFTLVMACLYIDPSMISGPLHKRGGTPFFLLSLIPLFAMLLLLRRSERGLPDETSSPLGDAPPVAAERRTEGSK